MAKASPDSAMKCILVGRWWWKQVGNLMNAVDDASAMICVESFCVDEIAIAPLLGRQ